MSKRAVSFGSDELYAGGLAAPAPLRAGLRIAALSGTFTQVVAGLRGGAGQTSAACVGTSHETTFPPVTF
ncbi:hypothetical protein E1263_02780 [Kribbella antibiotica]|uniref:Uncharacterized protein n=1 Tax=Kribbella antibiotica TaxID=190195 RepID=A0A4R4ZWZ7_9ACTN|nr:hypothetical protein [Kribbella antibiotica]TDD62659.1 hypothetical protein E1263_02780 [Kribbella antibiotica]